MGDLADRLNDFNRKLDSDTLSAIATAVAELEIRDTVVHAYERKRAEQAWAGLVGLTKHGARALFAYAPAGDDVLGTNKRFVCGDQQVRVDVENHGEPRRLSVVVLETDGEADADLLERRGTELVEAGERLLREYKAQKDASDLAANQKLGSIAEVP